MEKFIPQSPDPYLNEDADMHLAKFGHLNAMLLLVNAAKNNVYADNTAALAGGLEVGDVYSTATGEVRIVV
jgi:hypothetical protein